MLLSATPKSIKLRSRALYVLLAVFLQPCVGPCEWQAIDIGSKGDIKRAPFSISANDMKWSVSRFKPRDLVTNEKLEAVKGDKRFVFRGKGENLNNFAEFGGIRGRGLFSLGNTFSLDESRGLRSGQTSAWAYATYLDDADPVNYQINVLYDEALPDGKGTSPGWVARAFSNGTMLDQCNFPGDSSLDVRLVQYDDRLEFLARATPSMMTYGSFAEGDAFKVVHSETRGPATHGFDIGFGAFGLDKRGEVFMDMLWFLGPELGPEPGSEEVFAFSSFSLIGGCLGEAKTAISGESVSLLDIQEARNQVANARSQAESATFTIKNDISEGNFDPQTVAKTAGKIAKKTYKTLHSIENKLGKMLDKGEVKTSQLKGICKKLNKLIDSSVVGRANMLGVKVKKLKQLEKIGYPIPAEKLPAIFGAM